MDFCAGEEEIELSLGLAIGGGGGGGYRKRASEAPSEVNEMMKRKKEMQARRRQETRRKREEKKKQMKRNVVIRAAVDEERGVKRERIMEYESQPEALKQDGADTADQSAYAFPIYAAFQYVPFANGFAFPCIAPAYRAELDAGNKTAAANQIVSFRPFQGGNKSPLNEDGNNVKAVSSGSVGRCSSDVSENRSISSQDGSSSSDSASHWRHSSSGSDVPGSSNQKAFYNPSTVTNAESAPPSTLRQPTPTKVVINKEDSTGVELIKPANIPISSSTSLPQSKTPITKDNKVDNSSPSKPPMPQLVDNQKASSQLARMPCVSATGNGPDGKTITGFLYRYNTTAEVSIVCVCHGESFSPAEFVKHAGGIDIAHPLRHITVVP